MRVYRRMGLFVGAIGAFVAADTQAAIVTWGAVHNISGPGNTTITTAPVAEGGLGPGSGVTITNGTNDVNTQGTQVFGINYSGTSGSTYPYTATINGQLFDSFRDLSSYAVTYQATGVTNTYVNFGTGSSEQYYGQYNSAGVGPNPDYTLSNAAYSDSAAGTIKLGALTTGHQYLVQMWVSDPRGGTLAGRFETVTGSPTDVNVPTLNYSSAGDGQWVTGTFLADSDSQTFTFAAGNNDLSGSASAQINLLQLRDITPVPEPTCIAVASVAAIGMLTRRKRLA